MDTGERVGRRRRTTRVKKSGPVLAIVLFVLLTGSGVAWLGHVAKAGPERSAQVTEATSTPGTGALGTGTPGTGALGTGAPDDPPLVGGARSAAAVPTLTTAGAATTAPVPPTAAGGRSSVVAPTVVGATHGTDTATDPPVPLRAIQVGGVTLDDTSPRTHCYLVRNVALAGPVRIIGITAGNPDVVIRPELCAGTTAPVETGDWTPKVACRAGGDLRPGDDGCYTGIEPRSGTSSGPLESTITLTLRVRCTSAAGQPCADSGRPAPSPARPVDVTWTQTYAGKLCYLAGGTPPNGIFC